jgi:alpha-beta hydrolase superfamily lysophospholipase
MVTLVWLTGTVLSWPASRQVGVLPRDLHGETLTFKSDSGATLKGWVIEGEPGRGVVVLLHGLRGNRLQTLERARLLNRQGMSALLFDFQAHGESSGRQITFGYLESRDAQAAVRLAKERWPHERIGVLGISLGGAAAVLADPPLPVNAMVLEMVYADIHRAIENRMAHYLGNWARGLTPVLEWQLQPRLGVGAETLRPLMCVPGLHVPKLFIVGERDRHTTLRESQELFQAACQPKDLWVVAGAQHEDLLRVAGAEYERRVTSFFQQALWESGQQ